MSDHVFHLSGRITRTDNGQGVFGLRVEARDAEDASAPLLAWGLTNRDGWYHIDLPAGEAGCCACPRVYLTIRDRDCRVIYDGCADRRCCESGKPLTIDVAIPPGALWFHLSRPLSWERIDEPLVPGAGDAGDRGRTGAAARRRAAGRARVAEARGLRHAVDRRLRSRAARRLGRAAGGPGRGAALPRDPRPAVRRRRGLLQERVALRQADRRAVHGRVRAAGGRMSARHGVRMRRRRRLRRGLRVRGGVPVRGQGHAAAGRRAARRLRRRRGGQAVPGRAARAVLPLRDARCAPCRGAVGAARRSGLEGARARPAGAAVPAMRL